MTEKDDAMKEVLPLTLVTSEQPITQITAPSSNPSSCYQSIISLKVPIAETESDAETSEDDDEVDVEQLLNVTSVFSVFFLFSLSILWYLKQNKPSAIVSH